MLDKNDLTLDLVALVKLSLEEHIDSEAADAVLMPYMDDVDAMAMLVGTAIGALSGILRATITDPQIALDALRTAALAGEL
jgi:hypothetical protein